MSRYDRCSTPCPVVCLVAVLVSVASHSRSSFLFPRAGVCPASPTVKLSRSSISRWMASQRMKRHRRTPH